MLIPGLPATMLAQYGIPAGVPGLPGMSIPGSAVPGMATAASPITAGQVALAAGGQYPGLAGKVLELVGSNWCLNLIMAAFYIF